MCHIMTEHTHVKRHPWQGSLLLVLNGALDLIALNHQIWMIQLNILFKTFFGLVLSDDEKEQICKRVWEEKIIMQ